MSEYILGPSQAPEAVVLSVELAEDAGGSHSSHEPPPSQGPEAAAALTRAFHRLTTLHEGWAGVTDVAMCGRRAIPTLTALLGRPDPSGLFELRCRAVAALAALGASDGLLAFLRGPHEQADPVARAGEDAVVSTAARTLGLMGERRAVPLLVRLAMRRPLPGMIDALGHFHDPLAIPALIRGLDEDDCRISAENALARFGPKSRDALLRAVEDIANDGPPEPRARRSAMKILAEIGIEPHQRSRVRRLIWDEDPEVSLQAADAYFRSGPSKGREEIMQRLSGLMPQLRCINRIVGRDLFRAYAMAGRSGGTASRFPARRRVIG